MSWESPAALLLGLTIPAVVLLWVLRPLRPRLRVGSLLLWPGSPAERQSARPWQRLRNHPLLWLQVAAAALLALSAAGPYQPASAAEQHVVVLLDATGSMRARDVAPSRFAAALGVVLDLARRLGPGQDLTLIRLDEQPRALVTGARSAAQVEAALAGQSPSHGPADAGAALALAASLGPGPARWVLVGDGGIVFPDGARRPAGTHFEFIPVGQPAGNVAVSGLAARPVASGLALQAELRNLGPAPVSGKVHLLGEGELISVQEWRLEPDAQTYLSWSHLPPEPRWYEARIADVDPAANALDHDDRAWVALANGEAPAVLLVSEGNSFLERLLGVHAAVRSFRAAPADWPGLAADGAAYPLVVFDRLSPAPPPAGNVLLVGPPSGEEFRPRQVWPRADHPLLRHVDWSEVQVAAARRLPADEGWETVIDSDGGPLLAVREARGRREAVLTFALGQSDLPLRPAFPVLMVNLLDWLLARPAAEPQAVRPGAAVVVDPLPLAQELWAESAAGSRHDLAPPWPPLPFRPPAPGVHRIVQAGDGLRQEALVVAEGYHPLEAALAPRPVDLPAEEAGPLEPLRGALAYWPWLVAAVLAVSLVEWWVDARGR